MNQARGVMSAFRKTTTLGQPLLDAINMRAQDLIGAVDLLSSAVECSDTQNHSQELSGATNAEIGNEFTAASTALIQAFAGLKRFTGISPS